MRLSYLLVVALTGFLACSEAAVASDADKSIVSETARDQVLSDRELIDTGANDNGKRFLRTNKQDTGVESDESDDSQEERFSLIQTSNTPRYLWWFENEMTPRDVRKELRLTKNSIKLVKRSIYQGYVKYYDNHCTYFENRKKAFCRAKEY
ncbi:hypothetical protein PHYPSEUDO_007827 [Phytophthora pseudosyringae]|uniref:RxLR effector protein n=1 Tax=Phytophthora pseudosyringae TaxID=221518 RepID=A0A8T1VG44_9STRA|nr:hypothetical protein PHYPSEUDO_007827 [Phytophthora pseudosyringae]